MADADKGTSRFATDSSDRSDTPWRRTIRTGQPGTAIVAAATAATCGGLATPIRHGIVAAAAAASPHGPALVSAQGRTYKVYTVVDSMTIHHDSSP